MFLFIRKISAITGTDIALGIYCDLQDAELAAQKYREKYLEEPEMDPWKEQAQIDEDSPLVHLVIEELAGDQVDSEKVFLVSRYSEVFGQIEREIVQAYEDREDAKDRCHEIDLEYDEFPHYALIQELTVGEVASDAPEDQPEI